MFHRHRDTGDGSAARAKPGRDQHWVVPVTCPTCGAAVDQATAAMDPAPHCEFCHQPLPAQPRARF